jgi:hypothetical protein
MRLMVGRYGMRFSRVAGKRKGRIGVRVGWKPSVLMTRSGSFSGNNFGGREDHHNLAVLAHRDVAICSTAQR